MMTRPLPKATALTLPFWEACKEGRLVYQHCGNCNIAQFPPQRYCRICREEALSWKTSARNGTVFTHTTVYRAPSFGFKEDVPYILAIVEMDEGFRIMVQLRHNDLLSNLIGRKLMIEFEPAEAGFIMPIGRLA